MPNQPVTERDTSGLDASDAVSDAQTSPHPRQSAADSIPCQAPLKVSAQSDFAKTPRKSPYVSPCTNGVLPWELRLSIELLPGKQQLFLEQLESPELPTNWVTACEQTKGGCLCLQHTRFSSAERAVRRASTLHFTEKPSWALACDSSALALTVTWPTFPLPLLPSVSASVSPCRLSSGNPLPQISKYL